ncbi:hypothetical protein M8C21_014680 [Ambrosia artemisiifolia]|uniref:protein-serine/threonine phosphatase n=1 Tax=Ambrosia artemisiifolia TaxID=4212 RepID=A0AAD5C676_AMBAR|nr:hypothetical protein M8C21_014680 [Ambrosia artemisiifolia]
MSHLGFNNINNNNKSSVVNVYHGDISLGELDIIPTGDKSFHFPNNVINIHHISPISERCSPLSVLLAISSSSVRCKLESLSSVVKQPLLDLHASCFYELKTAVVLIGDEEVHLVAMPSKLKRFPCFWCCVVPSQLYNACLWMLNTRCLSIVFDLDETLIVANTMRSFEDRIEVLTGWIGQESDPVRDMYHNERRTPDMEKVRAPRFGPTWGFRCASMLPQIRDTSVLVRLRPAWEDLRSYLIAKGRKRFEVMVLTLEKNHETRFDRARKSLLNVFKDRNCHPRMAMVIDDRLKVWEEKDQPRVHVVPAFTPYYAPQAETANAVPVLCVARNVACNVRGGFFKEFDENFLRRVSEYFYEDEVLNLPSAPDVCSYLMPEDASFVPNGNTSAPMVEGMNASEVAHRLNQQDSRNVDQKSERSQPLIPSASIYGPPSFRSMIPSDKPSLLGPIQAPDILNKQRAGYYPPSHGTASSFSAGFQPLVSEAKRDEVFHGYGLPKKNLPQIGQLSGVAHNQPYLNNKRGPTDSGNLNPPQPSLSIGVLQEIGQRCGSKVEYRSVFSSTREWRFSYEVLLTGEKVGFGMGNTRKDAQQQAADNALRSLADQYVSYLVSRSKTDNKDLDSQLPEGENGFLWDSDSD